MRLHDKILQLYRAKFPLEVQAKCGHQDYVKGEVTAYGITQKYKLPLIKGQTELCHDCISKMTARCHSCNRLILPGDPVRLHARVNIRNREGVRKYKGRTIICDRFKCDEFFGIEAGSWQAPGVFIPLPDLVPSPDIELRLSPRIKKP